VRRARSGGRWRGFSLVVCGEEGGMEGGREGKEGGYRFALGRSKSILSLFVAIWISRTKLKGS
jgi:hypothetical protein